MFWPDFKAVRGILCTVIVRTHQEGGFVYKPRRSESGFTLIELIVVLVILGFLAAIVVPNITSHLKESKKVIAKEQITELDGALQLFALDLGRFPTTSEGLQALLTNPGGLESWKGPYLKKELPLDPWGKPYVYRCPATRGIEFDLFSYGPQGIEGQGDEIGNWK
jgi:general secretion pathway protein G